MTSRSTEPQTAESAYQYALRLLTGRDYTSARLLGKLSGRGVCELDAEATLVRLQNEGWLNDRRYAVRFAEAALADARFYGPRLRQEMRRRGFEAGLVDDVLGGLQEYLDEGAGIRAILERRYPDFRFPAATDRDKRRIIGYLQRRGYGLSAIIQALKAAQHDQEYIFTYKLRGSNK
ncbi:MAG: regulatory protein RecX [Steroidobacteraceae bacterium]|nr:regulatory protein RecX [Deltaproteobacteria bacterium]